MKRNSTDPSGPSNSAREPAHPMFSSLIAWTSSISSTGTRPARALAGATRARRPRLRATARRDRSRPLEARLPRDPVADALLVAVAQRLEEACHDLGDLFGGFHGRSLTPRGEAATAGLRLALGLNSESNCGHGAPRDARVGRLHPSPSLDARRGRADAARPAQPRGPRGPQPARQDRVVRPDGLHEGPDLPPTDRAG